MLKNKKKCLLIIHHHFLIIIKYFVKFQNIRFLILLLFLLL